MVFGLLITQFLLEMSFVPLAGEAVFRGTGLNAIAANAPLLRAARAAGTKQHEIMLKLPCRRTGLFLEEVLGSPERLKQRGFYIG